MLTNNQKALISGASAGAFGFTLTLPLDYMKQHLQSGSSVTNIRGEIMKNGWKVLFRGGMVGLGSIVPQMAIKYYTFQSLLGYDLSYPMAGVCAGLVDGVFLGPVLAKQSMRQMNIKNGNVLIKSNFGQLMVPMALRNGIYTGIVMGNFGIMKNIVYGHKKVNFLDNFMMASVLNIPGTLLCSPFDVIRANHISDCGKKGLGEVVKDIWEKNGWKGFYRGYKSLYFNFALRFPLTLALQIEIMKKLNK